MIDFPLMEVISSYRCSLTVVSPVLVNLLLEFDIFIYQKSEINSTGGDSLSEVFGLVFDESKKIPTEIADSNIWFSLDHPKVHVD